MVAFLPQNKLIINNSISKSLNITAAKLVIAWVRFIWRHKKKFKLLYLTHEYVGHFES
jgi:hypothetical protein